MILEILIGALGLGLLAASILFDESINRHRRVALVVLGLALIAFALLPN